MDNFYEVVNIKGKNFGCVALKDLKKGTIILKEKPQCADILTSDSEVTKKWTKELCTKMLKNFNSMSKSNQEAYLQLSNQYKEISFDKNLIENETDEGNNSMIINSIIGIYETNKFKGGVGIQASRFNHSCCANTEAVWNKVDFSREFRILKKITKGNEITINYLGMIFL